MEQYAASFQKLADTFYGMPYPQGLLKQRADTSRLHEDTNEQVCSQMLSEGNLLGRSRGKETGVRRRRLLVRALESGKEEEIQTAFAVTG